MHTKRATYLAVLLTVVAWQTIACDMATEAGVEESDAGPVSTMDAA